MSDLPRHIGYIVDGNRRWAKARGLPSSMGHRAGREALKVVLLDTIEKGTPYVSAFVFSTENWKRSRTEVQWLMRFLVQVLKDDLHVFVERNIRLRVIGSKENLSKVVLKAVDTAEHETAHLTGGQVLLCLNYGGQLEIADAVKKMLQQGVTAEEVTPERISEYLYAPDVPPCDLIVRTSGEQRLSNFMLWRSAYSELLFLDKAWPDMTKKDVADILKQYARRGRRFGG
ncbi:di-trans,poly-cis-decaprenylcistransferase [Candidatus Saccharibacteria bacterium]|nr:di-trans,poly-cis-decaprenylcistransferase [Candidatus Saccharibacteria bacterium]